MTFFDYARQHGLALFPCRAGEKAPAIPWKSSASTNCAQWESWCSELPNCNFAVAAEQSGIVVLDIDASKVGRAAAWSEWCKLCNQWGLVSPLMPMVETARGGWHCYVKVPPGDLRGTAMLVRDKSGAELIGARFRGYAVAPGSSFEGRPYLLMPDAQPPHECPDGLRAAMQRPAVIATRGTGESDPVDLAALVTFLASEGEFVGYDQWLAAGMACKLACGDAGLEAWRCAHDETVTPDVEITKWASFATEAKPGCVTIASLIARARTLGWKGGVRRTAEAIFSNAATSSAPAANRLILSDAEFIATFRPPAYVLDGILQRAWCYALTAQTGAGKTAIALRLAAHIGLGRPFADRDVQQGRVLYFASENHVDVQARWIAMAQHMGFTPGSTNVHFVAGITKLSGIADAIKSEATAIGELTFIVVDTSAATFEGDDENSNVHAIEHAKRMRGLTALVGNPTVLVLCHPTKSANSDNLIPRGGGSFLAEVDGNLCARKTDSAVELHHCGKFRGPDFAPMLFRLDTVTAHRLKDHRGKDVPTVLATPISDAGRQVMVAAGRRDEDAVLRAIEQYPGASMTDLAKALGWQMRDGRPYAVKARRAAERLANDGLIMKHRDSWVLTSRGQKELNELDRNYPVTAVNSAVLSGPPIPPQTAPGTRI